MSLLKQIKNLNEKKGKFVAFLRSAFEICEIVFRVLYNVVNFFMQWNQHRRYSNQKSSRCVCVFDTLVLVVRIYCVFVEQKQSTANRIFFLQKIKRNNKFTKFYLFNKWKSTVPKYFPVLPAVCLFYHSFVVVVVLFYLSFEWNKTHKNVASIRVLFLSSSEEVFACIWQCAAQCMHRMYVLVRVSHSPCVFVCA